jgi:tRNA A37 threonylcarbamoyladenosine modification protein TsaB
LSTAKGLSFGLTLPLIGVGRLEIEAHAFASYSGRVVAVHKAGRSEFAWASYASEPQWRELSAPRLTPTATLADELPDGALVTGDIDDALAQELRARGLRVATGAATIRRALMLAELGWRRLAAGSTDDPNALEPLYLREPAIGPQT